MKRFHLELNFIARQYNEKSKFIEYDRAIKKLQCHHINSFLSPQNAQSVTYDYDVPVYTCKFSPSRGQQSMLAIANENGIVCLEDINRRNTRTFVQTHNNTVFDLAWMPGERKLATVSGDHTAKLWDCGQSDVEIISEFLGHGRSVKCVCFKPENTAVFATGSRDGSLIIWDTRSATKCSRIPQTHHPDQVIPSGAGNSQPSGKKKYCPIDATQPNSVTGLTFQNDNTLISSGSFDQCIRIWDMRKTYSRSMPNATPKHQLFAPSPGFSHLCIDPSGTKLFANCLDSYIYCFNINSYDPEPIAAFYGHGNTSFYVKSSLSPDGNYLLSGSTDKLAYIWNIRNAELSVCAIKPLVALPGHTAEVACIAMSYAGDMKAASCSDDGTYRLWFPYNLKNSTDIEETRDSASSFDKKVIDTVRMEWRNKRKLGSNEDDVNPAKREYSSHTKNCRFYNTTTFTSTCACRTSVEVITGMKRRLSETDNENEEDNLEGNSSLLKKKRLAAFEIQERTPPKFGENRQLKTTPTNESNTERRTLKPGSKRKLLEMSPFAAEERVRKMRLSTIREREENSQNQDDFGGLGVISDSSEKFDNILTECRLGADVNECNKKTDSINPKFTSPTSNLPNYVKDGTSPYLHRCPRLSLQKENIDWLTKLRKENGKSGKSVTPEEKSSASKALITPTSLEKLVSGAKRRLTRVKSSPSEGRGADQTLHKYFKVSNKPSELNFIPQEVPPKKSC